MEIKKLCLEDFGKFHNRTIELGDRVNVIYGENESGKSTLHAFVRGMLFGIEKKRGREAKTDSYSKYLPWGTPGAYQGSMELTGREGRNWLVYRNFFAANHSCTVTDRMTGRTISEAEWVEQEFSASFRENIYRNTLSIEQLSAGVEKDFAGELQNLIANLTASGAAEFDVSGALQRLHDKKKELSKEIAGLDKNKWEARTQEQRERTQQYDTLSAELQRVKGDIAALRREMAEVEQVSGRDEIEDESRFVRENVGNAEKMNSMPVMEVQGRGRNAGEYDPMPVMEDYEILGQQEEGKQKKKLLQNEGLLWSIVAVLLIAGGILFGTGVADGLEKMSVTGWVGVASFLLGGALCSWSLLQKANRERRQAETEQEQNIRMAEYQQDLEAWNARREKREKAIAETEVAIQSKLREADRIAYQMDLHADAWNELQEAEKELVVCMKNEQELHEAVQAVELSEKVLQDITVKIHDNFGVRLNRKISDIVRALTDGAYTEVAIDEQMNVKVLSGHGYQPLERLSTGTIGQIYLAVRLAMAELFFPEEPMPLILDDVFMAYDDERLRATLNYLAGCEKQILLFTCHTREKALLEEVGIRHHYIEL